MHASLLLLLLLSLSPVVADAACYPIVIVIAPVFDTFLRFLGRFLGKTDFFHHVCAFVSGVFSVRFDTKSE